MSILLKKGEYKVTYTVEDSSHNKSSLERTVIVENQSKEGSGGYSNIEMGPKYIDGILIVNKQYALPKKLWKWSGSNSTVCVIFTSSWSKGSRLFDATIIWIS